MDLFSLKKYVCLPPDDQWHLIDKIMKHSHDAMMILDGEFKILEANESALLFNKKSNSEIKGLDIGDALLCENLIYHESKCGSGPECEHCSIQNTMKSIKLSKNDITSVDLLFTYRNNHVNTSPLNISVYVISQDPDYYLFIAKSEAFSNPMTDVAMMNRMQTVGKLSNIIVHDFKNVMTSIEGYTHLSSTLINNENFDKEIENNIHLINSYLERVKKATDHAKTLSNQILDYSKGKNDELVLTQLDQEVKIALEIVQGLLPKDIHLSFNTTTNPKNVYLKPSVLHEIIVNLVSNAIDAIDVNLRKGNIEINIINSKKSHLERGILGHFEDISYYVVEIKDNGSGISKETAENIFKPFYSTKEKEKGTGIGLYLVYSAMKEIKGNIILESKLEQGTTFRLFFPSALKKDKIIKNNSLKSKNTY